MTTSPTKKQTWNSETDIVEGGGSRAHLRPLALQLSQATGDAKLARLVELALVADTSERSWIGGKPATPEQRYTMRADKWRRVWAHLAGEPNVLVMGRRARSRKDEAVWIVAELRRGKRRPLGKGLYTIGASFPEMGTDRRRGQPMPRQEVSKYARKAGELAGQARSYVAVVRHGKRRPTQSWEVPLPSEKQAARCVVRTQLAAAERKACEIAGKQSRMRLDQYLPHLVVLLLHHGHGELAGRGLRRTAKQFFNLEKAPMAPRGRNPQKGADKLAQDEMIQLAAVRAHYAAACRLMGLERPPRWSGIG